MKLGFKNRIFYFLLSYFDLNKKLIWAEESHFYRVDRQIDFENLIVLRFLLEFEILNQKPELNFYQKFGFLEKYFQRNWRKYQIEMKRTTSRK